MPIYEYACQKCGAQIEVMQKISDAPLKKHETCGGKLEKQWSNTSFQLKGSGWYVTDYAAKKPADAAGKTETATDAKTVDAKTDAAAKDKDGKSEATTDASTSSGGGATTTAAADGSKSETSNAAEAKSRETKSNKTKTENKSKST